MNPNFESKAYFPESREGPSSTCEVCEHVSFKVADCFDRVFPDRARVTRFKCENDKCKGRVRIPQTKARTGRTWDVEKILD